MSAQSRATPTDRSACDSTNGVGDSVMHALAKLSLILALTVLGAFFMVAAGHDGSSGLFLVSNDARLHAQSLTSSVPRGYGAPHAVGSILALLVLGVGLAVLAVGSLRPASGDVAPAWS